MDRRSTCGQLGREHLQIDALNRRILGADSRARKRHAAHDGQRKIEPREHRKRHEPDKAHAESDGYKRPHPRLPEHPAADKAQTRIAQRRRSQQATSDERRETRHPFQIKRNEQTEVN